MVGGMTGLGYDAVGYDAVWINGSVGTGKSTAADRLGDELERRRIPGAVIDVDAFRRAWPAPPGDPFRGELALANVTAAAANFRAQGARVLIAAGVIEEAGSVARWAAALGANRMLHVVLRVDPSVAAARLQRRHDGDDPGREWHLRRHPELAAILESAGFESAGFGGHLPLDTTALTPSAVAARIARLL